MNWGIYQYDRSMTDKATLRRIAKLLSPATAVESEQVCQRLVGAVAKARTGCLFLPMPGELDVTSMAERRADIEWHTTRTVDRATLSVHPVDSEYEDHPFGYSQPVAGSPVVDPASIDVWLVPGLAFDVEGHRLGHGAGYYDRLLAQAASKAGFFGVTTERRLFPGIPTDEFDVAMHAIVTERRLIRP
jgi:5-formyltetrahydrofolate cyclo-ligase